MWSRLLTCLVALSLALGVSVGTGLIFDWGKWYSYNVYYRTQTDSLLRGKLALSEHPTAMSWDLVWANGGVHQPWGLGVPMWRLPFEAVAKLFGQPAFPDRLALTAAILVSTYGVIRVFASPRTHRGALHLQIDHPSALLATPLLILFPPFLTLCQARFNIYEETQAYAYLAAVGLLTGMMHVARCPTTANFYCLSFFAGVAPLVRPTLVFYGMATTFAAWIYVRSLGRPAYLAIRGATLFCIGIGLLFLTNHLRFGSAFEFGHKLALNPIDAMRFASRFDDPYRDEPIGTASVELFSGLFLAKDHMNGRDWYQASFFPGQSSTFRWREFYFDTFDWSYLALICGGSVWAAWRLKKPGRNDSDLNPSVDVGLLSVWAILSAAPLWFMYLRFPFLSSRYLLDFAPAMAAAMLAAFGIIEGALPRFEPKRSHSIVVFYLCFGLWWSWQLATASIHPSFQSRAPRPLREISIIPRSDSLQESFPNQYGIEGGFSTLGIDYNGAGWDAGTGETKAAVALFVEDPKYLELEVTPARGTVLSDADYEGIQAKIGLEFLRFRTISKTTNGRLLRFSVPKQIEYRSGIEVAFIGFMTAEELNNSNSRFRLLRARWRDGE